MQIAKTRQPMATSNHTFKSKNVTCLKTGLTLTRRAAQFLSLEESGANRTGQHCARRDLSHTCGSGTETCDTDVCAGSDLTRPLPSTNCRRTRGQLCNTVCSCCPYCVTQLNVRPY